MLGFVRSAFRRFMGFILWLNLIFFAVVGAVSGFLFAEIHAWGAGGAGIYVFGGLFIGILLGLLTNIVYGGFVATILNIDENVKKLVTGNAMAGGSANKKIVYTTARPVDLHSEPNLNSTFLACLPAGKNLTILGRGEHVKIRHFVAPWVNVQTEDGKTGWCFSGYLKRSE